MENKKNERNTVSVEKTIERLMLFFGVTKITQLADKIGVNRNTISNWKYRNTLDLVQIFPFCTGINWHWLLTGEGEMYPNFREQRDTNELETKIDILQKMLYNTMIDRVEKGIKLYKITGEANSEEAPSVASAKLIAEAEANKQDPEYLHRQVKELETEIAVVDKMMSESILKQFEKVKKLLDEPIDITADDPLELWSVKWSTEGEVYQKEFDYLSRRKGELEAEMGIVKKMLLESVIEQSEKEIEEFKEAAEVASDEARKVCFLKLAAEAEAYKREIVYLSQRVKDLETEIAVINKMMNENITIQFEKAKELLDEPIVFTADKAPEFLYVILSTEGEVYQKVFDYLSRRKGELKAEMEAFKQRLYESVNKQFERKREKFKEAAEVSKVPFIRLPDEAATYRQEMEKGGGIYSRSKTKERSKGEK